MITEHKYIVLKANINHPETLKTMEATITSKGCELIIDNGLYDVKKLGNIISFLEECIGRM